MQKDQQKSGITIGRLVNIFLALAAIFFAFVVAASLFGSGSRDDNRGSNTSASQIQAAATQPAASAASIPSVPASTEPPAAPSTTDSDVPDDDTIREQLEQLGNVVGVSEVAPGLRRWELTGTVEDDSGQAVQAQLNVFQIGRFLALGSVHDARTGNLLASSVGGEVASSQDDAEDSQPTEGSQAEESSSAEPVAAETDTKAEQPQPKASAASSASHDPAKASASTAEAAARPASAPASSASSVPQAKAQPSAKFGLDGEWLGAVSPLLGELEKLDGVVLGDASMKPEDSAYIFFDPRCPYCKQTYKTIKDNWPQRRVKWIPAVILGESPEAYAMAASLLSGSNSAGNLDKLMTGGRVVSPNATDEQKQQLLHNATTLFALMNHMDPNTNIGVPAMYWAHRPTGQFAFASGASQKVVLEKVFGPSSVN